MTALEAAQYYGEFNQKDGAPFHEYSEDKHYDDSNCVISKLLYDRLCKLGIIDNTGIRDHNVGTSDYSNHLIQPWSIWIDYNLNAFDADIIKRILRTKTYEGKTEIESRIEDYNKILHICNERIRQLQCTLED